MKACSKQGCEKKGHAEPVLQFWAAPHYYGPPVKARLDMPLCKDHMAATKLGDILNEEAWTFWNKMFEERKIKPPEKERTILAWKRLA